MSTKRLILTTDGLNRYKYRVLSAGGRLDAYKKNPVLLFDHVWSKAPIGRLEDIRFEEGQITALPIFDEQDEFALSCKSKWENGFLFAASIYFDPVSTSSDPELILPGQSGETVTEWDLLEVSMVTVPGNSNAATGLSYGIASKEISPIKKTVMDLTKTAKALGLDPSAITDDIIVLAIETLKNEKNALSASRIEGLIETGKSAGKIDSTNETAWRALALKDYDSTSTLLKVTTVVPDPANPPAPPAAEQPKTPTLMGMLSAGNPAGNTPVSGAPAGREGWTFDDWSKKDSKGLSLMRTNEPDKYKALAAAKYESAV